MDNKTLKSIHEYYVSSIPESTNSLEIVDTFHKSLVATSPDAYDVEEFDSFVKAVYISKVVRQQMVLLEDMVMDFSTVLMYIIIYLNSTKNMGIIMSFTGRIKALRSELSKLMEKPVIYDRFGLMEILENRLPDQDATLLLREATSLIIGIITRTNRKEYHSFLKWLRNNPNIDEFSREKMEYILNIPFEEVKMTDYTVHPKKNNYRSIHHVLQIAMGHPLSGGNIEIQFRTRDMHECATHGPAAHLKYEQNRRQKATKVFTVTKKEFKQMQLINPVLSNYKSLDEFFNGGIHEPKAFLRRTISPSLVCL